MIQFNQPYNREEFTNFIRRDFLPDDFVQEETSVSFATQTKYSKQATKLGVCKSLDLVVYEIKHCGKDDPRVGLSKESFRLLAEEWQNRALVIFVPEDSVANYRFSLIEVKLEGQKDSSKLERKYSNPRRYSYLLGVGIGGHTPNEYLLSKGKIRDRKEGNKNLSPWEDLLSRFSVEILTKAFYAELSDWYAWAIDTVTFPGEQAIEDKDKRNEHRSKNVIRLLTRLLFVWFLKQKRLIPDELFDEVSLKNNILRDFGPNLQTGLFKEKSKDSVYYKAILQNLFFATLNCPIVPQSAEDKRERGFRKSDWYGQGFGYDYLMRYESLFSDPARFLELVNKCVPFLNGGLFDCLDDKQNKIYIDGFSDNLPKPNQLIVPDYLFFGEVGKGQDLSDFYGGKKKKSTDVYALLDILKKYNFTIEENMPFDQEVSLDPELLGKVFENLLASYNPETKTTARKQTGSFYTPREIVQYMVDESLVAHLKRTVGEKLEEKYRKLMQYTDEDLELTDTQKSDIIRSLQNCKVLDPACGSGAFPVGVLQQMVHILSQLDPHNEIWKDLILEESVRELGSTLRDCTDEERKEVQDDINRNFDDGINRPDYARKLYLIEKCIYGVDIQSIAVQISKLRFFISLVVDQKPTQDRNDNFGIRPLPNLEAKFAAANTLIGLRKERNLFDDGEIDKLQAKLVQASHRIFGAKSNKMKNKYKARVEELQAEIAEKLESLGVVGNEDARLMRDWKMFDQNASSPFFDPEWMFGVSDGFDIVIGNPPYLKEGRASKSVFDGVRNSRYYQGKMDLWYMFACCGIDFLSDNGVLSFIATNNWVTNSGASIMRNKVVEDSKILQLCDFSNFMIFESASIQTMVMLFEKNETTDNYVVDYRRLIGDTQLSDVLSLLSKTKATQVEYLVPTFNRKSFVDKYITFSSNEALLDKICSVNNAIYLTNQEVAQGIVFPQDFLNKKNQSILGGNHVVGEGVFALNNYEKESANLNDREIELIKPLYTTEQIHRYYSDKNNLQWAIYTDSTFKEPSRMNSYPNLKAHLDKFTEIITSDNRPYGLHRARDERFFKGEKVVALRKCVGRPLFSYSDFDCYLSATFYVIKTNRVDMKYLTGLLNSKLIKFWLKNRGKMQGNNYQLDKEPLVAIPIAAPDLGIQQPIINLVDRIIVAYRDNKTEDIASIEAQINSHIYRLYNINDDEKAIIDPEGQKPASEETLKRICGTMDKNFSLLLPVLCDSVYTLENLNQIDTSHIVDDRGLAVFDMWKMLMQLQVFNLIANLDLTAFLRSNYRAESNTEKRCNLKHIIITTYEVYKYLFGYKDDACNGKLEILKSLANQLGDSELMSDIANFEQYAKEFGRLSVDRIARNISVHYDQDPIRVYDNLEAVNEKEEVDRLCVSLGMLENLSIIITKYSKKYQVPMVQANDHYCLSIKEVANVFPDKENKLGNMLNDSISTFSKRLDDIVQSCRKPEIVAEKLNIDKEFIREIKPCIDNINPGIHMHFIYLDLSSAIRAYFNAECYYEKQVNLRSINIIIYEGFKHIYGYDDKDLSLSFWQKQIFPILESTEDSNIKDFLLEVENELKVFASSITISDVLRRERSIHYRFEDRDNTLLLFHDIIESNPFVELQRALTLVNLLNRLIKLNTSSIEVMHQTQNSKSQKNTDNTIERLNDIISLVDRSNVSDEQKQSLKETTEKIKSLLSMFSC